MMGAGSGNGQHIHTSSLLLATTALATAATSSLLTCLYLDWRQHRQQPPDESGNGRGMRPKGQHHDVGSAGYQQRDAPGTTDITADPHACPDHDTPSVTPLKTRAHSEAFSQRIQTKPDPYAANPRDG
jgi:hypothetical protein